MLEGWHSPFSFTKPRLQKQPVSIPTQSMIGGLCRVAHVFSMQARSTSRMKIVWPSHFSGSGSDMKEREMRTLFCGGLWWRPLWRSGTMSGAEIWKTILIKRALWLHALSASRVRRPQFNQVRWGPQQLLIRVADITLKYKYYKEIK